MIYSVILNLSSASCYFHTKSQKHNFQSRLNSRKRKIEARKWGHADTARLIDVLRSLSGITGQGEYAFRQEERSGIYTVFDRLRKRAKGNLPSDWFVMCSREYRSLSYQFARTRVTSQDLLKFYIAPAQGQHTKHQG